MLMIKLPPGVPAIMRPLEVSTKLGVMLDRLRLLPAMAFALPPISPYSFGTPGFDATLGRGGSGSGSMLAPIGAWLAVKGKFGFLPVPSDFFSSGPAALEWLDSVDVGLQPIILALAVVLWLVGFDIIYAMQDVDFDKSESLFSIPVAVGKKNALWISGILHMLSAAFVIGAGFVGGFGRWYWVGIFLFIGMLIYQHTIVKPNDVSRVNLAFMTANGIASVVFAFFAIADIYITHKHW